MTTTPRTAAGSVSGRFVPPTNLDGNTVVLPVTVPDGRRFELRYPQALHIAEQGFSTGTTISSPHAESVPGRCCERGVLVSYTTVTVAYGDAPVVGTYTSSDGQQARYYAPRPSTTGLHAMEPGALVFQFGPWMVRVYDMQANDQTGLMNDAERSQIAANLGGQIDENGYLILEPRGPLTFGSGFKSEFSFGGWETGFGNSRDAFNKLGVGPRWLCGTPGSDTAKPRQLSPSNGAESAAAWCDPSSGLHVNVEGTKHFVDGTIRDLKVRALSANP